MYKAVKWYLQYKLIIPLKVLTLFTNNHFVYYAWLYNVLSSDLYHAFAFCFYDLKASKAVSLKMLIVLLLH